MTFLFIYFFVSFYPLAIYVYFIYMLFVSTNDTAIICQQHQSSLQLITNAPNNCIFFYENILCICFTSFFFVVYESLSAEVQLKWNKLIIILFTIPFRFRKSFVCINIICYLYLLFSVFNSLFFSYNFWFFGWSSSHFLQMILKFSDGKCIK